MKIKGWSNTKDNRPSVTAVWLQDFGWVQGCDATEARPGMIMLYNGGSYQTILHVKPKGKKSMDITVESQGHEREWTDTKRGLIPCQQGE